MKSLADYGSVRGVCYGWRGGKTIVERDLGYARRLGINSTRIWLDYRALLADPAGYVSQVVNYVRMAWSFGISTMPILWNGNMIDPAILKPDYRVSAERYMSAIIAALKDEPGLLMWDIMNEPTCNDYMRKATASEKPERDAAMWGFVRHGCQFVKGADPVNAITVGNTFIEDTEPTVDLVDVISFHDYLETRKRVNATYDHAEDLARRHHKPLINSELACLCRANPYDMALEICESRHVGWYLFELMVHDYWGDVHGIVYPDGTVRDPAIVAAIMGFHRNRNVTTRIKPNPNKEGNVAVALDLVENALKDDTTLFLNKKKTSDDVLEAAEFCANLLEGSEMVPMYDPPSARILAWRRQPEAERDLDAISSFTYDLAMTLKKCCRIF